VNNRDTHTWLILIHQIPPKPDYFRVKIWRRLQKIGAVAVKQSVYVLPDTVQSFEDLHWIVKEIEGGGGTASLSRSVFLEGLSNDHIEALFTDARNEDYRIISQEGQGVLDRVSRLQSQQSLPLPTKLRKESLRLQRRFDEIVAIDFFQAPGRKSAAKVVLECKKLLVHNDTAVTSCRTLKNVKGKVWVTRQGLFIDRIGCIWLIRQFIDSSAQFKYIPEETYAPLKNEIRFDMFAAEFTHQGDKCSFEVLVEAFSLDAGSLAVLAQIVHDIDLKDDKFSRPETAGIRAVFSGITRKTDDDQIRLLRGLAIFDELYISLNESAQD